MSKMMTIKGLYMSLMQPPEARQIQTSLELVEVFLLASVSPWAEFFFFLYAVLCAAFNQLHREIGIAVEKCASPANFHGCGLQWVPLWKMCTASSLGIDPVFSRDGITLQNWLADFIYVHPGVRAGFRELDFQNCPSMWEGLKADTTVSHCWKLWSLNLNV